MQEMTLLVNSLFGQKQEASLLELHLGASSSQVLMHCGTVFGHGAEGAGLDTGETPLGPAGVVVGEEGVAVAVAVHLVQGMVETEVTVIVEIVLEVVT
jgi:hypothetical protein